MDLGRVEEMLPLALVALGHIDTRAAVLEALEAPDPDAYQWAVLIDATPEFLGEGQQNVEPGGETASWGSGQCSVDRSSTACPFGIA